MPVRYGRPPKRKRSVFRSARVANDDDVCVNLSTVAEDDAVSATVAGADDVRRACHSLPPLPARGAPAAAASRAATARVVTRTHVSRFDGARASLVAEADGGLLTTVTGDGPRDDRRRRGDGGDGDGGDGDVYPPGYEIRVGGRLACTVHSVLGEGGFGTVYEAALPRRAFGFAGRRIARGAATKTARGRGRPAAIFFRKIRTGDAGSRPCTRRSRATGGGASSGG